MKRLFIATAIVATMLTACNSKKNNVEMLTAHEWLLDEVVFEGNDFTETPPAGVTIMFADSTDRVSGNGGCNGYFGTYTLGDDHKISMGPLASTLMACPNLEFEGKYFKWLEAVDKFEAEENSLRLKVTADGTTLVYKPVLKAVQ